MQPIEDLVKHTKLPPLSRESEYCVRVTHITDPHNFYVRLFKFKKIVSYIEKITTTLKPSNLHLNDIILFNFNIKTEKPKYARGKIMYVGENGCNVFAMDYGDYKENIPYDHIWECDKCLIDMEPLAINCKLANCAPRGNSWGLATDAFITYVGDERAHMKIVDRTSKQLIVELYNTCAVDLATMLALSDFTTLGYVHNDLNRITFDPPASTKVQYKFKELKISDAFHVRVLNGKSLDGFYVADLNDYQEYLKEQENINYYSKQGQSVEKDSMKCGDLVSLWEGHSYERGYIKEVYGDSNEVLIQMVDTGKVERVHFRRLKNIPHQCLTMPVVSIFCSVKETLECNLNLLFQPGRQFVVTVRELGNGFESPNIVSISHLHEQ